MKILEYIALETSPGLFAEFSKPLHFIRSDEMNFPAYRLEIDPEMVIWFYLVFSQTRDIPEELKKTAPYLRGALLLPDTNWMGNYLSFQEILSQLDIQPGKLPLFLAQKTTYDWYEELPMHIRHEGIYLGPGSKLMFWPEQHANSLRVIWRNFLLSTEENE